jgi:hypothetical protein
MAEDDTLMPDWERFYLYRVESYLIHKYEPELVDQFTLTFKQARERRQAHIKHDENIFSSKEALMQQIVNDIANSPFRKKDPVHRSPSQRRPGIGQFYQGEFTEL